MRHMQPGRMQRRCVIFASWPQRLDRILFFCWMCCKTGPSRSQRRRRQKQDSKQEGSSGNSQCSESSARFVMYWPSSTHAGLLKTKQWVVFTFNGEKHRGKHRRRPWRILLVQVSSASFRRHMIWGLIKRSSWDDRWRKPPKRWYFPLNVKRFPGIFGGPRVLINPNFPRIWFFWQL